MYTHAFICMYYLFMCVYMWLCLNTCVRVYVYNGGYVEGVLVPDSYLSPLPQPLLLFAAVPFSHSLTPPHSHPPTTITTTTIAPTSPFILGFIVLAISVIYVRFYRTTSFCFFPNFYFLIVPLFLPYSNSPPHTNSPPHSDSPPHSNSHSTRRPFPPPPPPSCSSSARINSCFHSLNPSVVKVLCSCCRHFKLKNIFNDI